MKIPAVNGVTWSLFYETSFYLAMALLVFVFGRSIFDRARIVFLLGILIVVVLILLFGQYRGGMSLGLFLHLFLGAALAGEVGGGKRLGELLSQVSTSIILFAWFSFTTLFSLGLINYPDWYYYPISGIATMLIISKVGFSPGVLKDLISWRPLVLLGRISYSFYLLHALIILWIFKSTLQPSNIVILFCLSFGACLAAAIVSYILAERPYFKRSNMSF